jgi:hypothetical protein
MKETIQCQCGAVKVEVEGEPVAQFYCHCDDCQSVHGAGYIPVMMFPATAVKIVQGELGDWMRKVTPRRTCRACGVRMFAEPLGGKMGVVGVLANLFPKGRFKPTFHCQCQHAMLPVRDGLPHYKGFPSMWGGSDEKVEW